jgi:hypothetical protein
MRTLTLDEMDLVNGAFSSKELIASVGAGAVAGGLAGALVGGGGAAPGAIGGALIGGITYCAYEFLKAL